MGIGSGLGGSFGLATETGGYGVYQAPTVFPEVNKAEIKKTKTTVQGGGLAAGRTAQLASRRVQIAEAGTGSIETEVVNKKFGTVLSHIFAGGGTPAQQAATTAYLQSHTIADNASKSLTAQNGVPDTGGTVRRRTGKGGKVTKASFSCTTTTLLMCSLEVDFQKVTNTETLAAPSYPATSTAFHGGQMRVRLGTFGSEAGVTGIKGISLDIERPQDTERIYAATTTPATKANPIMNDYVKVSGSIDLDFMNESDFEDRFSADSNTSVVLEWISTTMAGTAIPESITFTMPAVFFDDTIAVLSGPGIVTGSVPFTAQLDLTNGQISCAYVSTDTTI